MNAYSVAANALFGANPPIDLPLPYRDSSLVVDRARPESVFGSPGPVTTSPLVSSVAAGPWARTDTEMLSTAAFNITRWMNFQLNTTHPTLLATPAIEISHSSYESEDDGRDREGAAAVLSDQEPYPPSPGPPPTKPLPPLPKNWLD